MWELLLQCGYVIPMPTLSIQCNALQYNTIQYNTIPLDYTFLTPTTIFIIHIKLIGKQFLCENNLRSINDL